MSTVEPDPISNIEQLRRLAGAQPDVIAYVHLAIDGSESEVTWRELHERSSQVAAALAERGVGYADRVGLGIRNSPELVFAILGTWKLGAVHVQIGRASCRERVCQYE